MTDKTPTPLTDAQQNTCEYAFDVASLVTAEFARKLERELYEVRERNMELDAYASGIKISMDKAQEELAAERKRRVEVENELATECKAREIDYNQAALLATQIWEREYKEESPDWEVVFDTIGVLTQISNMTSGMAKSDANEQLKRRAEEAENELAIEHKRRIEVENEFAIERERREETDRIDNDLRYSNKVISDANEQLKRRAEAAEAKLRYIIEQTKKSERWAKRDLSKCHCDHNETCEHCFPEEFRNDAKQSDTCLPDRCRKCGELFDNEAKQYRELMNRYNGSLLTIEKLEKMLHEERSK